MTEILTLGKYIVYGMGVAGLYWLVFKKYPVLAFMAVFGLLIW